MTSHKPKPLTIFKHPKHPRYNWDSLNATTHEAAINRAIEHDAQVREGRKQKGFPSLKRCRNKTGVRFGSLPKRDRPQAEIELTRLVNRYIAHTGKLPSAAKMGSLIGNATWIIRHVKSGNRARWRIRHIIMRRVLDQLDASQARLDTPADPSLKVPSKSSWRGLDGI
jgi:hypothetical protein